VLPESGGGVEVFCRAAHGEEEMTGHPQTGTAGIPEALRGLLGASTLSESAT
jgi:hypothetical protein